MIPTRSAHLALCFLASALQSGIGVAVAGDWRQRDPDSVRVLAGVREYPPDIVLALSRLADRPELLREVAREPERFAQPELDDTRSPEINAALRALHELPDAAAVASAYSKELGLLRKMVSDSSRQARRDAEDLREEYSGGRLMAATEWQRALESDSSLLDEYAAMVTSYCRDKRGEDVRFPCVEVSDRSYFLACPPDEAIFDYAPWRSASQKLRERMEEWRERFAMDLLDQDVLSGRIADRDGAARRALAGERVAARQPMWRPVSGDLGAARFLAPVILQPLADQPEDARIAYAVAEHARLWSAQVEAPGATPPAAPPAARPPIADAQPLRDDDLVVRDDGDEAPPAEGPIGQLYPIDPDTGVRIAVEDDSSPEVVYTDAAEPDIRYESPVYVESDYPRDVYLDVNLDFARRRYGGFLYYYTSALPCYSDYCYFNRIVPYCPPIPCRRIVVDRNCDRSAVVFGSRGHFGGLASLGRPYGSVRESGFFRRDSSVYRSFPTAGERIGGGLRTYPYYGGRISGVPRTDREVIGRERLSPGDSTFIRRNANDVLTPRTRDAAQMANSRDSAQLSDLVRRATANRSEPIRREGSTPQASPRTITRTPRINPSGLIGQRSSTGSRSTPVLPRIVRPESSRAAPTPRFDSGGSRLNIAPKAPIRQVAPPSRSGSFFQPRAIERSSSRSRPR
ncbi:MAG: hypothetical protein U1D55_01260 [Phycisphaerae bacterium]